ncbi:MAG: hypothetical protein KY468_08280 [Armatimonadetes bacterium]|nr:hypothetical protein [Armatimonadota bacterium]
MKINAHPALLYVVILGLTLAPFVLTGGCARTPADATINAPNQLLVQVTVRGVVNPSRFYFVAFNATDATNTSQGPLPVVSCPWGNGWGAGRITHYVQVGGPNQPGFYGVYRFPQTDNPVQDLINPVYLGRPVSSDEFQGTNTFRFSLDLDLLQTPSGAPATMLNMNIIATDRVPINTQDCTRKLVDALGPGAGNTFVTIPVQQSRIFRDEELTQPESQGDITDPDLDLVDWQIEVRRR